MSKMGVATITIFASLSLGPAGYAQSPPGDLIKRGETAESGATLAGGRMIATPYGGIASPNLTPDRATGIGAWSDDDFYKVMHEGLGPDGHYMCPVMPFDH